MQLENFAGPFDLLLQLVSKHQLDITEVALAQVTDEFIAHVRVMEADGTDSDRYLDQISSFLVVAATLLDLKAARLLPQGEVEDPEDLALLEARDLLFARLLQYRAYKQVAGAFADRMATAGRRVARAAPLEEQFVGLLPELVWSLTPQRLAELAAAALAPKPGPPEVGLTHLHNPAVSVTEQAEIVVDRLRRRKVLTFTDLISGADNVNVVVARFLSLLELFRQQVILFDQAESLGILSVRWVGNDQDQITVSDEFDDDAPAASQPDGPIARPAETQTRSATEESNG